MVGRIPIVEVHPVIELGARAAKATAGEALPVRAIIFREGHDRLGAEVVLTGPDGVERPPVRMRERVRGTDRYEAWVTPDEPGDWWFGVQAWSDPLATWQHNASVKVAAGVDVDLMFTEGRLLLERLLAERRRELTPADRDLIAQALEAAGDMAGSPTDRMASLSSPDIRDLFVRMPLRDLITTAGPYPLQVDRARALFSAWYEFFPRSEGASIGADGMVASGTFRTAVSGLERAAQMGFDVVYLPPIHPIGEVNRKGPNNTLTPGPDDVGSPWAIGSAEGGHDAIHPDLGTFDDFDAFVAHAHRLGLEVALDLALQAAPDHPWVSEHPEFFTTRADGSIAYAENPPKKYQDIYPINFDNDFEAIKREVLRVIRLWISHGVSVFRVDNPHTKTVEFWEQVLGDIHASDPDVIFLSEAFTRPAMMHTLGAAGFHQSYTYFTWRTEKSELEAYLTEVSNESDHLIRPNFFVNTPDILHESLQYGGPNMFRVRAVLAAMGSPSWGVYSGYELFEHVAVRPGSEEYLDSEKYQIRIRDWGGDASDTLIAFLTRLNEIRRQHPALQILRGLTIHDTDSDSVIAFSKQAGDDVVITVVNLDPHGAREATVRIDPSALDLPEQYTVHDELTGQTWTWGAENYVRLDPSTAVAHILTARGNL